MTDQRLFKVAAILALALFITPFLDSSPKTLNQEGPSFGSGNEVLLFQSYDCKDCYDLTNESLSPMLEFINQQNLSLTWKNVESNNGFPEELSHCIWQEFPDHWVHWNQMAFLEKGGNETTWDAMDQLLYATEYTLLLPIQETSRLEKCIYTQSWDEQIQQDTSFSDGVKLPALFSNGQWYEASMKGLQEIAETT